MRRGLSTALTILSALALASCSNRPADTQPGGGRKAVTLAPLPGGAPALDPQIVAAADPRRATMPVAAYELDDAKARIVNRARIIVGDKCMANFGFTPMPWTPEGAVGQNLWSRWGMWDEARAADYGYLPPEDNAGNPYPVRYVSVDASNVYFGLVKEYHGQKVPDGGCGAEEARAVFGDTVGNVNGHLVEDLDNEARARAAQDSRVVALMAAWQQCVKAAGWNFTDPQMPFEYWTTRRGSDKNHQVVSAAEKSSALTDIHCKKTTGLLGTWLAADVAYQKALIDRASASLVAYKQAVDDVVARANAIIAHG